MAFGDFRRPTQRTMPLPRLLFLASATLLLTTTRAQLVLDQTLTPAQLVQGQLVGPGVVVSNIKFNGSALNTVNEMLAAFNGSNTFLGLDAGLVMCTGGAQAAVGPNDWGDYAEPIDWDPFQDPDLNSLAGTLTFDHAVLEFDFVPTGDSVVFQYVFGSEEYPEWVDSEFNDLFGFFLSGPGLNGSFTGNAVNIATLPGSGDVVSVNTVNDWTNSAYYVSNGDGGTEPNASSPQYIQFDGYTVPLHARAQVQCGQTYHIKLAICDQGDPDYDSGIFLKQNSFSAAQPLMITVDVPGSGQELREGCGTATWTISRTVTDAALTVPLVVSGTASSADHGALPTSVTFAPGQAAVTFTLDAIADGTAEGPETIIISIASSGACNNGSVSATLTLTDLVPMVVVAQSQVDCTSGTVHLSTVITGGAAPFGHSWSNGATSATTQVPLAAASHSVVVTDGCGGSVTASVQVNDVPVPLTLTVGPATVDCVLGIATFNASTTGGAPPVSIVWSNGSIGPTITVPTGTPDLMATANDGCTGSVSTQVTVPGNSPPLQLELIGPTVDCSSGQATVLALFHGGGGTITPAWSTGATTPQVTAPMDGSTLSIVVNDACGHSASSAIALPVALPLEVDLGPDRGICADSSMTLTIPPTEASVVWSTGDTTSTIITTVAGIYEVLISNGYCSMTGSVRLTGTQEPSTLAQLSFCAGETVASRWDIQPDAISWSDGDLHAERMFLLPGTYTYSIRYAQGCMATGTVEVEDRGAGRAMLPNAFTPDGDGINDVFKVEGHHEGEAELRIFDRWGGLLRTIHAAHPAWDGDDLPQGTYVYQLAYHSGCGTHRPEQVLGHVTMLR